MVTACYIYNNSYTLTILMIFWLYLLYENRYVYDMIILVYMCMIIYMIGTHPPFSLIVDWLLYLFAFYIVFYLQNSKNSDNRQKRKFSSFFRSLVIELDKDLYGPDNHLVEVWLLYIDKSVVYITCIMYYTFYWNQ